MTRQIAQTIGSRRHSMFCLSSREIHSRGWAPGGGRGLVGAAIRHDSKQKSAAHRR
jgi:hypothetical protein